MSYDLSRREFLQASGALVLAFSLPVGGRAAAAGAASPASLNAFLRIAADNRITVILGKSEMGQGVYSALAQILAEELEADWSQIAVESAPVDPAYNDASIPMQVTGGSTSVATSWEQLRRAGASAREMLVAAAAAQWNVAAADCRAERGIVSHAASQRRATFGQLAAAAATLKPPADVRLKTPAEFRLVGKPLRRRDTPAKVDGSAVFGGDVRIPGMVYAMLSRPPLKGATVAGYDEKAATAVRGVLGVVRLEQGMAVVGRDTHAAQRGVEALSVRWDLGSASTFSTDALRADYSRRSREPGVVARRSGDPTATLAGASRVLEAEYSVPYLAHAPMEPLNCVASVTPGRCEIWTGTQFQSEDRTAAARVAGLAPEQVFIHTMYLGGGFGRRANPASDFVVEAVALSKAIAKPVKVLWTRQDDLRGGWYRPMWVSRLRAGLGANGELAAWHHTIVGQSINKGSQFEAFSIDPKTGVDADSTSGASDLAYAVPHVLVDLHTTEAPVNVQWWRSVGHSHTAFVVESFIDEAAHALGRDPLELRLALLKDQPRRAAVLRLAADKAGWGRQLPAGRALGIAVHESFGSVVSEVAEVSVENGRPRVHRVTAAVHCGTTVNPDGIAQQVESAVTYGLTAALDGEIVIEGGQHRQTNFKNYRLLPIHEAPLVEVHIVPSTDPPTGMGEPATPPIAAAVANALFALTGKRVRDLPLSRHFRA